ncbi:hypothetical protein KC19_VG066300 [Ceratodon purpureus]|uniref:Lysosomal Pro-X carboxypeptidase n=1 Tax=Ceratodon purpureus TaxID=3225 RepID=A0A8T0HMM5_CERPU|nr:hypothetical protein KC19_VG066300 [Ceratodon purpureus]
MGATCRLWTWACISFMWLVCFLLADGEHFALGGNLRRPRFPHHAYRGSWTAADESLAGSESPVTYSVEYYTQVIDHFSFRREGGFQQRYLIEKKHWKGAAELGPIFMYCGNEGDAEWFAKNSGFLWEIAPQFGALILVPEHRYYGKSMPYGTTEASYKDADTLSALTSEQALADFATLVTDLKRNLSAEASPVVLFGGSYGGMLAAWMRLKYPHIAIGAVAASAPILQFEDIVPSDTFYKIVSADFKLESTSCFNTIRESWDVIEKIASKNGGLQDLSKQFHMCRDLNASWELRDWLESAYSYVAMVDYPIPTSFMTPLPAYPIREICRAVDGLPNDFDILSRIFAGVSIYYNYTGQVDCFLTSDPGNDDIGVTGWNWQACTEMVMPMSSNSNNSMFAPYDWNLEGFMDSCAKTYGVRSRPSWITTTYGGKNIKEVLKNFGSNMLFSNGLLDPWSGGGVLENISSSIVALVAPEGAHHLDLRAATKIDPDWLIEQRAAEVAHIAKWIAEYHNENTMPHDVADIHAFK